jgi:hypothetical protein
MNLQNLIGELNSSQVSETVSGLASELNSGQRGGLVGSILSGLGSAGVDVQSLLNRLGVNPQVADNPGQATPEEAAALAVHAHENHPGVVQSALSLYERHPRLIKMLGLFAAAAISKHASENK